MEGCSAKNTQMEESGVEKTNIKQSIVLVNYHFVFKLATYFAMLLLEFAFPN